MNKVNSLLALLALAVVIGFTSCKNEDEPSDKPGSLALHLHTLVDATEVENYGEPVTLSDGRPIAITAAQVFISNIKLIKSDGAVISAPSTIVLMKQGVEDYEVGEVPNGNYTSIRFDVGLSDAINGSTPAAENLILSDHSMWFGATVQPEGFVFVNFQGMIDTTHAPFAGALIPFQFKFGTNAHRTTVTMPDQNFTIAPELETALHLNVNYAKLLDGVKLSQNINLHITTAEQNSWFWVDQMKESITSMFSYGE